MFTVSPRVRSCAPAEGWLDEANMGTERLGFRIASVEQIKSYFASKAAQPARSTLRNASTQSPSTAVPMSAVMIASDSSTDIAARYGRSELKAS